MSINLVQVEGLGIGTRVEEITVKRSAIFFCVFDLKCHEMKQIRMQISKVFLRTGMHPDPPSLAGYQPLSECVSSPSL